MCPPLLFAPLNAQIPPPPHTHTPHPIPLPGVQPRVTSTVHHTESTHIAKGGRVRTSRQGHHDTLVGTHQLAHRAYFAPHRKFQALPAKGLPKADGYLDGKVKTIRTTARSRQGRPPSAVQRSLLVRTTAGQALHFMHCLEAGCAPDVLESPALFHDPCCCCCLPAVLQLPSPQLPPVR